MARKPSIERLLEFHQLLNRFAEVERVVHIKRGGKYVLESDSEHAYNLAMTAWFVADSFPGLDRNKVVELALVHDLVEIHAGDTFAFGEQAHLDSKAAREAAAQKQLAKDWADFPALHAAIAEYEALQTAEARFTYALDKLMPMLTVYLNDGFTWRDKKLTLERMAREKRQKMSTFPEVLPYWEALHGILLKQPELFP